MTERYKYLKDFEFSNCHIRSSSIIAFTAQKWPDSDSLEQRETALFFYYPRKPVERMWAVSGIGQSTGVHGCAVFSPEERWIFLTDDGQVYVVGKGDDNYEDPISERQDLYFSNVTSVHNGHAIAVGPRRKVYLRQTANNWIQLDKDLFPQGEQTDLEYAGFNDIDGFSEEDMYACGGRGDLWHYTGHLWINIDIPTNSVLKNVCCADDGLVYITTNRREILKGRGETWEIIKQDETKEILEAIVYYDGKVIVSTISELFVVDGNEFKVADLGIPDMNSKAHLAAGDSILVVAGIDEATMFDGKSWSVILEPEE